MQIKMFKIHVHLDTAGNTVHLTLKGNELDSYSRNSLIYNKESGTIRRFGENTVHLTLKANKLDSYSRNSQIYKQRKWYN